ncbi:methylated-DNA--[protein]-cysteine S-methyltransferase [Campylobacter fetus]|uniref:Methylated-DNA--protein-cysteine methyltransferase n=2 Tax=Campylobacter fetus TaxID=196 RepID=A0AAX0HD28_CAMFE|nr:methylated-DNA--[protein]-cysteine S-methyltransferase [Campylobacter fetus]AGZ81840.2 O6-alkylguanine-DNA-alkyltransferase [Campylobacter fetus subsp. testudinum 03-427]AJB45573.1 cysteine methyltransferase [Campylobacter fetus subsp. testudinum]ALV64996.2 O6-alkylguanine-DNA-alkyltransferase [Campylobacter fetus subsp. testudinum Sp3]AVK81241.1 methylated-DNA--[protein]-cysteine S-methyltransferase [Campylobacter fetus subsp. testudinum]EAI4322711.1 methylated-DNA--[protein]-cysteine S-me
MKIAYMKTPIGNLKISCYDGKIINIDFCDEFINLEINDENLSLCVRELELYFQGKLVNFTTKIDITGSKFEQKVYKALLEIPYGSVVTYKYIAAKIGSPNAARAIGNANSKNKIPIIIPCHRVVGVSNLGGYSGGNGIETKKYLLNLEKSYL